MRRARRIVRAVAKYMPPLRAPRYEEGPMPPPVPPGRIEYVDGRGEIFFRDSGPETAIRGTALLLHGWMVNADLNWAVAYSPLIADGYRVIALDHRGHGRGLRSTQRFTLKACADDAAALLRHLGAGPATVVGYSMGGAIAQLIARDHPDVTSGVVLCATALQWRYPVWTRFFWRLMSVLQFLLRMFPRQVYAWMTEGVSIKNPALAHWVAAELHRGSAYDIAEAGRQMAEFDSRPWIGRIKSRVAVVLTTEDHLVPPSSQREIAEYTQEARVFHLPANHVSAFSEPSLFTSVLLAAIHSVEAETESAVAAAVGEVVNLPQRSLPVERRAEAPLE